MDRGNIGVVTDLQYMNGSRYVENVFWDLVLEREYRFHSTKGKLVKEVLKLPSGKIEAEDSSTVSRTYIISNDDHLILFAYHRAPDSALGVNVCVASPEQAAEQHAIKILQEYPEPEPGPEEIAMTFSFYSGGVSTVTRSIEVPEWDAIKDNYPEKTSESLDNLINHKPADAGKIILMYGPPGTGKTTCIRSLVKSWASWCHPQYITDPEIFFSDSGYMMGCILDSDDFFSPEKEWKLFIIEDADELISSNAKEQTGQGLARLLNLADGLVGQGLKIMVLITTNEPISQIHEAISRPGRCLANVHFPPFSPAKSQEWLKKRNLSLNGLKEMTLAELYEYSGHSQISSTEEPHRTEGVYL